MMFSDIDSRVQAAIRPQLDRADYLIWELGQPERVGRHHPDYVPSNGASIIDAIHRAMRHHNTNIQWKVHCASDS